MAQKPAHSRVTMEGLDLRTALTAAFVRDSGLSKGLYCDARSVSTTSCRVWGRGPRSAGVQGGGNIVED